MVGSFTNIKCSTDRLSNSDYKYNLTKILVISKYFYFIKGIQNEYKNVLKIYVLFILTILIVEIRPIAFNMSCTNPVP